MKVVVDLQLVIEDIKTPDQNTCEQIVSQVLKTLTITGIKSNPYLF